MLSDWDDAVHEAKTYCEWHARNREAGTHLDPIYSNALCIMAVNNELTIVSHPVGAHRDVFGRGENATDCIENKLVLTAELLYNKLRSIGRGGAGPTTFCFAMLDWKAPARRRRARFLQLGGNTSERVTQSNMRQFCASHVINGVRTRQQREAFVNGEAMDGSDIVAV